jgi:hypothetical protein
MLKITELRNAMEAAALALAAEYAACPSHATPRELELEKLAAAARAAYYAEFDKARALRAQYEAMPDDDANGSTNAGDTFPHSDHGNERFNSTEYWRCAIDSAQMMNDEAAATAKREADRAALRAEEATAAVAAAWKATINPTCGGQYAVTRKVGERREFITVKAGAVPLIESFYSREAAQVAADAANAAPVEVGCNAARAFHVGDDAYTVALSIGGGQLAYHVGPGDFPYFTKEQADALAAKVSASGFVTPADWTDGYGRPLVASMVAPRPALALA